MILAGGLLLAACTGSHKLAKQAGKLDAGGMYAEAAEMYLQSALRNPNNVEAKLGLKKTGQQVLDDRLAAFFKASNMGNGPVPAVDAYLDALAWKDRLLGAGVQLAIPEHYATDYQRVKGEALVELYGKGQALLAASDYAGAKTVFAKIASIEPGYKDAASLQSIAYLEPLYQQATAALGRKDYRSAVADLDHIIAKDPAYKNAAAMRNECLEKGRISVAVLQGATVVKRPDPRSATLQAMAISALAGINDPFIRVVDRQDLQRLLDEQKLAMSGVVDESTAVGAGKLLGAQAVLVCTLTGWTENTGQAVRSSREAYEGTQVETLDNATGQTVTTMKYKPVSYTETSLLNSAALSFTYKLVDMETGVVLLSQVVDRSDESQATYGSYNGNAASLYPKLNGQVNSSNAARRSLLALFEAPKAATPATELGQGLLRSTTGDMARQVQQAIITGLH